MAKFKMLKDATGCPDGIHAELYVAGAVYDLPAVLAKNFVIMEVAEPFMGEVCNDKDMKEKSVADAPKNKAVKSAPKNKSK